MSEIVINNYRLNLGAPEAGIAAVAVAGERAAIPAQPAVGLEPSAFAIVQMSRPLDKSGREALAAAGARLGERISEDAFICHLTGSGLEPVRHLNFVQEAIYFPKEVKLNPATYQKSLDQTAVPGEAAVALAAAARVAAPPIAVDVLLHTGAATAEDFAPTLAEAAGLPLEAVEVVAPDQLRLAVTPTALLALQEVDAVRKVEPVPQNVPWNDVARTMLGATPALAAITTNASDQVVCVADTGIDLTHPAFPAARIARTYNQAVPACPWTTHMATVLTSADRSQAAVPL